MRLFVAARPAPAAAEHLATALGDLRRDLPGALRWTDPATWHLTLAFLGEVDEVRVPRIAAAVEEAAGAHEAIPGLALSGAGSFGSALWIGLTPADRGSAADRLARAVQRGIRGAGVPLERRPWRGHLTIARARTPDERAALPAAVASLADYAGPSWDLPTVEIVHSILGPPLEHRVLARSPLGAGTSATHRPPESPTT